MTEQMDIDVVQHDIAANSSTHTAQQQHMRSRLEYCRRQQMTMAEACVALDRSPGVVKRYCRMFKMRLADYTPRALKAAQPESNG